MREIKFRAWEGGAMSTPFHLGDDHTTFDDCKSYYKLNRDCDSWVIMQFTGLKDRNGKDIYEGDVIAHISTRRAGYQKDGDMIYHKIVFGKTNPDNNTLTDYIGFWAVHLSDEDIDCGGSIRYQIDGNGAIVIGNIHQNPELLEKSPCQK